MTLLFDQNISYKIVRRLSSNFPHCKHVTDLNLINASDQEIWRFAKQNTCCIVTFDADFLNLATLRGTPPKIILLKTGNRRTNEIAELLFANKDVIDDFMFNEVYNKVACLEVSQ